MHCHLLVPGFLRYGAGESAVRLEASEILIAKGRRKALASESAESWLFGQFGVEKQRDWPAAPYALLADGGAPGSHYWLRADPVHLQVDRDRLVLAESGALNVTRLEAEALVETLNVHFHGQVRFHPMQPERWYAQFEDVPNVQTSRFDEVRGEAIGASLPTGPDAMRLNAIMNEAQMLLFEHPVNAARETRGEPAVNSVWFWGGGSAQARASAPFNMVLSDDPVACGLARSAGIPTRALPAECDPWLDAAPESGIVLIVLDSLVSAPAGGETSAHQEPLQALEHDWLAPFLRSLRRDCIGMITLHLPGPAGMLEVEIVHADLRHFWRMRKPLSTYVSAEP